MLSPRERFQNNTSSKISLLIFQGSARSTTQKSTVGILDFSERSHIYLHRLGRAGRAIKSDLRPPHAASVLYKLERTRLRGDIYESCQPESDDDLFGDDSDEILERTSEADGANVLVQLSGINTHIRMVGYRAVSEGQRDFSPDSGGDGFLTSVADRPPLNPARNKGTFRRKSGGDGFLTSRE